jgi:DNA-binding MarR family transcriptional regulator
MSRLYGELELDVEARWFPVLYLLSNGGQAAVTEIGERVKMTHPAIHQIAGAMSEAGLLLSETDGDDQRKRLLSLSPKGMEVARRLEPIWDALNAEIDELFGDTPPCLLTRLNEFEQDLDSAELYERMTRRLEQTDGSASRAD